MACFTLFRGYVRFSKLHIVASSRYRQCLRHKLSGTLLLRSPASLLLPPEPLGWFLASSAGLGSNVTLAVFLRLGFREELIAETCSPRPLISGTHALYPASKTVVYETLVAHFLLPAKSSSRFGFWTNLSGPLRARPQQSLEEERLCPAMVIMISC